MATQTNSNPTYGAVSKAMESKTLKASEKKNSRKTVVKVNVLNQEYKIATDGSSDRAVKVARYLDQSVKEIMKKSPNTQSFNALVLAAMNMAEKYLSTAEKLTRFKYEVSEKSKKIVDLLEDGTKLDK